MSEEIERLRIEVQENECEECGAPLTRWCCDDEHVRLCQKHYEAMCARMEGDPIHCPLRSEMMRVRGSDLPESEAPHA